MAGESSAPYLFGDLLALARASWVREMATRLDGRGYRDYRRSDAAVMRILRRRPAAIGQLGETLGVTRQAARKLATGLEQRGYASIEQDGRDARRLNVVLTDAGHAYAGAVVDTIDALNREFRSRVEPIALTAADAVLRSAIFDQADRDRAAALVLPPD
jgi:DNA-binding MarR family transcriptional regulator